MGREGRPSREIKLPAKLRDESIDLTLKHYCFCKQPYRKGSFMIACDAKPRSSTCQEWVHGACVGITEEEADGMADFTCSSCRAVVKPHSSPSPEETEKTNTGKLTPGEDVDVPSGSGTGGQRKRTRRGRAALQPTKSASGQLPEDEGGGGGGAPSEGDDAQAPPRAAPHGPGPAAVAKVMAVEPMLIDPAPSLPGEVGDTAMLHVEHEVQTDQRGEPSAAAADGDDGQQIGAGEAVAAGHADVAAASNPAPEPPKEVADDGGSKEEGADALEKSRTRAPTSGLQQQQQQQQQEEEEVSGPAPSSKDQDARGGGEIAGAAPAAAVASPPPAAAAARAKLAVKRRTGDASPPTAGAGPSLAAETASPTPALAPAPAPAAETAEGGMGVTGGAATEIVSPPAITVLTPPKAEAEAEANAEASAKAEAEEGKQCARPGCSSAALQGQWYCSAECMRQAEKDALARSKRLRDSAKAAPVAQPPGKRTKRLLSLPLLDQRSAALLAKLEPLRPRDVSSPQEGAAAAVSSLARRPSTPSSSSGGNPVEEGVRQKLRENLAAALALTLDLPLVPPPQLAAAAAREAAAGQGGSPPTDASAGTGTGSKQEEEATEAKAEAESEAEVEAAAGPAKFARLAGDIERELHRSFGGVSKKYRERARSIVFNLKDRSNPELRARVAGGQISPQELCGMTADQLASKELSQWRSAVAEEAAQLKVLPDADLTAALFVKKTHKGEVELHLPSGNFAPAAPPDPLVEEATSLLTSPSAKLERADSRGSGGGAGGADESNSRSLDGEMAQGEGKGSGEPAEKAPAVLSMDEYVEAGGGSPLEGEEGHPQQQRAEEEEYNPEREPAGDSDDEISYSPPDSPEGVGGEGGGGILPPLAPTSTTAEGEAGVQKQQQQVGEGEGEEVDDIQGGGGKVVWAGRVAFTSSHLSSVKMLHCSGERVSMKGRLPGAVELKGRVKLADLDTYLTQLRSSRSRSVTVVSVAADGGKQQPEDEVAVKEAAEQYEKGGRTGYAEPAVGVELYLVPAAGQALSLLHSHGHCLDTLTPTTGPAPAPSLLGVIVRRVSPGASKPGLLEPTTLPSPSHAKRHHHQARDERNSSSRRGQESRVVLLQSAGNGAAASPTRDSAPAASGSPGARSAPDPRRPMRDPRRTGTSLPAVQAMSGLLQPSAGAGHEGQPEHLPTSLQQQQHNGQPFPAPAPQQVTSRVVSRVQEQDDLPEFDFDASAAPRLTSRLAGPPLPHQGAGPVHFLSAAHPGRDAPPPSAFPPGFGPRPPPAHGLAVASSSVNNVYSHGPGNSAPAHAFLPPPPAVPQVNFADFRARPPPPQTASPYAAYDSQAPRNHEADALGMRHLPSPSGHFQHVLRGPMHHPSHHDPVRVEGHQYNKQNPYPALPPVMRGESHQLDTRLVHADWPRPPPPPPPQHGRQHGW